MREVRGELVVEGKLGGGMRGEGEAKKPVGLYFSFISVSDQVEGKGVEWEWKAAVIYV